MSRINLNLLAGIVWLGSSWAYAWEDKAATPSASERGYRFLTEKAYLPPDFDQRTFDEVWREWPEPLRTEAAKATPEYRRQMAYSRYGLTDRPSDKSGQPLQYVVDQDGNWIMNCFACHSGKVAGRMILGLPNSHFALQTLTEEIRATKLRMKVPLSRMDLGSIFMPLGTTRGTTNAVMFGVILLDRRDEDLNVLPGPPRAKLVHHDMDAPPWWHFKKKNSIYIDGFAPKGHRPLMQFMLVKENTREKFDEWEADFRDVFAYLESLESPKYPFAIDRELAAEGKVVFNRNCAECHGTYGEKWTYPNRIVPIDEVGTDRVRLNSLSAKHRKHYGRSWFANHGQDKTIADPGGYVAPPLDGIWASAPYFHNGSVPTLWHVLHPAKRPVVWRRSEDGYDSKKVGLEFQQFDDVPRAARRTAEQRRYFDTRRFGKSSVGHPFPDDLNEAEKTAVLEYLKTL
ncbi:MAG: c-type cytochrome [Planctomycetes bacterium]|nr:c-type cytochrome [Planctomycetota bacterium]